MKKSLEKLLYFLLGLLVSHSVGYLSIFESSQGRPVGGCGAPSTEVVVASTVHAKVVITAVLFVSFSKLPGLPKIHGLGLGHGRRRSDPRRGRDG